MPESQEHSELVRSLRRWVVETYAKTGWGVCVLCDLADYSEKPAILGGFRPDLWAANIPQTFTVVGEAKTASDLENAHSEAQYRAYVSYLAVQPQPVLVLAIPWHVRPTAVSAVERIVRELEASHITRIYLTDDGALRLPR